jgi:hypothetical protein
VRDKDVRREGLESIAPLLDNTLNVCQQLVKNNAERRNRPASHEGHVGGSPCNRISIRARRLRPRQSYPCESLNLAAHLVVDRPLPSVGILVVGSRSTLRPTRFPISARVARSGSLNRNLDGSFALKIRFSAARYSFCSRSSWFTDSVNWGAIDAIARERTSSGGQSMVRHRIVVIVLLIAFSSVAT